MAASTVSRSNTGSSGTRGYATRRVSRNGQQRPARPRIELRKGSASPEEAAAIAAAIEQFLRDTAPAPTAQKDAPNPWLRASLYEGAGYPSDTPERWA